ncbi:hypothetical protein [Dokdonella sp.]|uniref:DUF7933 domain-containing protein n=1 Tax=Dokdonella sp. TaxID=2291710 RepID=UPI001B2DF9B7|nr:hypothetical protein [Dokdonella sp.]MBO9663312.1 hypothetical protein [Dokdonella sp.]
MKILSLSLAGLLVAGTAGAASLRRAPATGFAASSSVVLGARALAQMEDNTPVERGGLSCTDEQSTYTSSQSYWRRFYLAEHGAPSSLRIESVTIGAESGAAPVTIRLHALAHATPADTIPVDLLRPIGASAEVLVRGQLDTRTIPVTGLLADAAVDDLVVEYHVGEAFGSLFYGGGNPTAETHPSFISAPSCGVLAPTPVGGAGFPSSHMILVANTAAPGVGLLPSFTPATIASGGISRLDIALANPLPSVAGLTSAFTVTLPAGLTVAAVPNAVTSCGGSVTTAPGSVSLAGATIAAQGSCTLGVDVTSVGGTYDLTIPVDALRTDQGDNTQASSARLVVVPAGGNGLIRSGSLNRTLPMSTAGTSYDMVGNTLNFAGALGMNWDLKVGLAMDSNSPAMLVFGFAAPPDTEFAVNGNGEIALLGDGEVVGPATPFSGGGYVSNDPNWYAGADGAIGIRFRCAGRLTYPVAGGDFCFGYVRLASTAPSGIPVRLVESAFDGDGNPVTVQLPAASNPPAASVAPASLSLSVAANAVSRQELSLANAVGSAPLRYSPSGRGIALAARPGIEDLARPGDAAQATAPSFLPPLASPLRQAHVQGFDPTPWSAGDGFLYALDDGAYEKIIGMGSLAGIWLNRYSIIEAQTIHSMSVMWPRQATGDPNALLGLPVNLVAYYDADADGDPTNAVRLGVDRIVTIDALDRFQTYTTQFAVPGPGDLYIGFVEHWPMDGSQEVMYAAAFDTSAYGGASYASVNFGGPPDIDHLGANPFTTVIGALGAAGNFTFRATGSGVSCGGAGVPWLRVDGGADVVAGGSSRTLQVEIDPAAGQLEPGIHHAELCIVTNDPAQRTLSVPITVQVNAPLLTHACASNGDSLFCDGFDRAESDDVVDGGLLDVNLPPTPFGVSFNFARGEWSDYLFSGDDFATFYGGPLAPYALFYWNGASTPGRGGGVADTVFGPYRVLRSGDTIGPDSVFSEVASGRYSETRRFLEGVDGYLGMRFYNEQTRQINYGYIHLRTTSPTGYPARVVGYGFNRAGGPITIP